MCADLCATITTTGNNNNNTFGLYVHHLCDLLLPHVGDCTPRCQISNTLFHQTDQIHGIRSTRPGQLPMPLPLRLLFTCLLIHFASLPQRCVKQTKRQKARQVNRPPVDLPHTVRIGLQTGIGLQQLVSSSLFTCAGAGQLLHSGLQSVY